MNQYKQRRKKYFKAYEWSTIYAMLKNNRKSPKICSQDFKGKTVVLTGATSGIGYLVAKEYAKHGANLICINRNLEKSEKLKTEIENTYEVKCDYFIADLTNVEDTHNVAEHLLKIEQPIDVLIHNAGVYLKKREKNAEGIEKMFMIHYLAPFIINFKLKEKLKKQGNARIILVNSEGHRFAAWGLRLDDLNWTKRKFSGLGAYGSAKLAQILSTYSFTNYFKGTDVVINAMHPGAVKSETGKVNGGFYKWYKKNVLDKTLKPTSISSDAIYYLGVSEEVKDITAKFFNLTTLEEPTPPALDTEVAEELWDICLQMGNLN